MIHADLMNCRATKTFGKAKEREIISTSISGGGLCMRSFVNTVSE